MINGNEVSANAFNLELSALICSTLEEIPSSSKFSHEQLEEIYALAYAFTEQRQYKRALYVFAVLCLYGPTKKHYLMGLALCLQMCGYFNEAVGVYSIVQLMFPMSHEANVKLAECQLAMGNTDDARETLDSILNDMHTKPLSDIWLQKIKVVETMLDSQIEC